MKVRSFNFTPHGMGNTVTLAATATTASVAINSGAPSIYIYNAGANDAYVRWTVGASSALVTDLPIPSKTVQVFNKGPADTFSAICDTGNTTTLKITAGDGS